MTSFKYKPSKIKYIDDINTLNSMHKKFTQNFRFNKNVIDVKKKKRDELSKKLDEIDKIKNISIEEITLKSKIKRDISVLNLEIYDIENDVSEIDYYKNAGDYIIDYYDEEADNNNNDISDDDVLNNNSQECNNENTNVSNENKEKTENITESYLNKLNETSKLTRKQKKDTKKRTKAVQFNKKTILDFFNDKDENAEKDNKQNDEHKNVNDIIISTQINKETNDESNDNDVNKNINNNEQLICDNNKQLEHDNEQCDDKQRDNEQCTKQLACDDEQLSKKSQDVCENTQQICFQKNKATIYEQYMKVINSSYCMGSKINASTKCKKCDIDKTLVQSEGIYVCTECGEYENIIIESDVPNYKDQLQEKPAYNIWMRRTGGCGFAKIHLTIMN